MTRDISSYGFLLSNITLFTLLYIILTITWKILEKTAFSPVDPQKKITIERSRFQRHSHIDTLTPKSSFFQRKPNNNTGSKAHKEKRNKSPKSGTVISSTKSLTEFQQLSPRRSKSPVNFQGYFNAISKGK